MSNIRNFGRNLDFLLSSAHGAKVAAARASGISASALGYILRGQCVPSLDTAAALAKVVDVPIGELLQPTGSFRRMHSDYMANANTRKN